MKLFRRVVGDIILFLDWAFSPQSKKRSPEEQDQVNQKVKNYTLYEFKRCPFCVKVRREMKRLNLNIEQRDAKENADFEKELIAGGGRRKVPCLRIADANGADVQWMYESNDIISHLQQNFS